MPSYLNINFLDNSPRVVKVVVSDTGIEPWVEEKVKTKSKRKQRYSTNFRVNLSKLVKERDHYTCQQCNETALPLATHHKDKNSLNDDLTNLVTLCIGCHRSEHSYLPDLLFQGVNNRLYKLLTNLYEL